MVARDLEALDTARFELSFGVRLFAFASLRKARHNSDAVFDEGPVCSIDAVLAAFWCGYLFDFDAGLFETVDNSGMLSASLLYVNFVFVVIWVDFVIVCKKFCT